MYCFHSSRVMGSPATAQIHWATRWGSGSHSRTVVSDPLAARTRPLGEYPTVYMALVALSRVASRAGWRGWETSHCQIVLSVTPAAGVWPSGGRAMQSTYAVRAED